jgi:hypothetical protein
MIKERRPFRKHTSFLLLCGLAFTILLLTGLSLLEQPVSGSGRVPSAGTNEHPQYGVVFVSSAEYPADEQQYTNGQATGASWNRWPMYWFNIESNPGQFNWSMADATVQADLDHGWQINAILLGTPPFYTTEPIPADTPPRPAGQLALFGPETATPQGLYLPTFTDGTDEPGPGKTVNPDNKWARFVFATVDRYRPGGVLAQQNNWPAGVGVTHWEMWNEPDLTIFWDGTLPDYARLLKVGYMATKQADAQALVLFGALANNFEYLSYYDDVLTIYDADPLAASYDYFHDILATHSYFVAYRSWWHVDRARQSLAVRGLEKPVWLNESGVPAWDDYPGPVWDPTSGLRATMLEQADYTIQSALYATYAGAENIFHFQLYDACGNQPLGTDFPPHNGELCDENGNLTYDDRFPCAGDANGLFTNPTDAQCFTQHPSPESPRPNFDAYRVLTTHFRDVEPLWWLRPDHPDWELARQEWLAFYRPDTGERLLGLWAREGTDEMAVVPATGAGGLLITPDGNTQTITPAGGYYTLTLPAATNRNAFWDPNLYAIGGRPYLLIEPDTLAPTVSVSGPAISNGPIYLSWSGDDGLGSGAATYDVQVAIDGGPPTPWLTGTMETDGLYFATPGQIVTFLVTAYDRAGNGSSPAVHIVQVLDLPNSTYLPATRR